MDKDKLRKYIGLLIHPIFIIAIAASMRLVPHPPNFAPIAAMALFGGAYLNKWYAFAIPLVALFISDLVIGLYSPIVMTSVYGSFIFSGFIGMWLKKRRNIRTIILGAIGSSVMFFLVTNFAVWLNGFYPRNITGLLESYTLAMPFYRNTLMGNLFYTAAFFGAYELALKLVKKPKLAEVTAK